MFVAFQRSLASRGPTLTLSRLGEQGSFSGVDPGSQRAGPEAGGQLPAGHWAQELHPRDCCPQSSGEGRRLCLAHSHTQLSFEPSLFVGLRAVASGGF